MPGMAMVIPRIGQESRQTQERKQTERGCMNTPAAKSGMAIWDVVVIGGGAAGLCAAAAAARTGMSCLVIDRMGGGGELMNLGTLHDLNEPLNGPDLAARLLEDATAAGAELEIGEATGLARDAAGWRVSIDNDLRDARAVILAIGLAPGTLGLDDEDTFQGRGLSHCAACDGPLFRGQPVVVAGAGRWAVEEARELAAIASAVALVTQGAAEPPAYDGFAVFAGRIIALEGAPGLEAVIVAPDDGTATRRLAAQAVFVQTGRRPALRFAREALACGPDGRLVTNDQLQCSMPGLFAAGDARAGADRTLAHAMANGRRAAASVHAMLAALGKAAD
jgi:thioredoxin reductase (NADPH)